jgi:nucleotide-binding universal stress UspA family protein
VLIVGQHGHAVNRNETSTKPPSTTHRIVVGVDGSPSSLAALEWATNQAQLTGSVLDVLMTWHWPVGYRWSPVPKNYGPGNECEKQLNEHLEHVRGTHPNVSIQPIVTEGRPAPLLANSSQGADLLVIGSRGHGEFSGMLLGSVSEHCVIHARCPVLVMSGPK